MSVNFNIPDGLKLSEFELAMMLASKLFEEGLISSGQGAEMVGVSKRTFVELLGKYNVSIFGYEMDEIEEDLNNV